MNHSPNQLKLDLGEIPQRPEAPRSRRLRFRGPRGRHGIVPQAPVPVPGLFEEPVIATCGLCGHRLTVLGTMTRCAQCGGIVARAADE